MNDLLAGFYNENIDPDVAYKMNHQRKHLLLDGISDVLEKYLAFFKELYRKWANGDFPDSTTALMFKFNDFNSWLSSEIANLRGENRFDFRHIGKVIQISGDIVSALTLKVEPLSVELETPHTKQWDYVLGLESQDDYYKWWLHLEPQYRILYPIRLVNFKLNHTQFGDARIHPFNTRRRRYDTPSFPTI